MGTLCRCCLNSNASVEIFERCEPYDLSYAEMISNCSSIPVTLNDGLPIFICNNCMNNLKVAYTFKMECYNAYKKLVNELSSSEKKNLDNLSNESTFDINNATSLLDYFKNNRVKKHDIIRKHKTKDYYSLSPKHLKKMKCFLNTNTEKYKYCLCGMKFSHKTNLKKHYTECTYKFETHSIKEKHSKSSSKKRHKREVAELICVICKKRYLDKNRFKKHTKKHFRKLNTSTGDSNAGEKSMKLLEEKRLSAIAVQMPVSIPEIGINRLLDEFNSLQLETGGVLPTREVN